MIFGIVTHVLHKTKDGNIYAYEPYVREMNLWAKFVDKIIIICPISEGNISEIEAPYIHNDIEILEISSFDITSFKNTLKATLVIPFILLKILKALKKVNHIHLRCPGNIGLLGCFAQVFFPNKPKTVKYAGNWDPKSRQPLSYRIQKWIVSNTFLTKNCKVLVYGEWKNQSKNIVPFFTASYTDKEIEIVEKKELSSQINFIFVGTFSKGKQPILCVKTIENLLFRKYNVRLDMFGEGSEFIHVKNYIKDNNLSNQIVLHGNQNKETVKKAYKKAHFLLFISKSEGWPKVVAEAMFWRCLPISSKVSCVDFMLDYGNRGTITNPNSKKEDLVKIIENYYKNEKIYQDKVLKAQLWSQKFTLNTFEKEIKKIVLN